MSWILLSMASALLPAGIATSMLGTTPTDLHAIMAEFSDITEFQFDSRVDQYRGTYVSGHGEVDDVGSVDLLDAANAPDGYSYKVVVYLRGDHQLKAVVFLRSSTGLGSINIGDDYSFTGEIIDITDWGFWFTAYIQGE